VDSFFSCLSYKALILAYLARRAAPAATPQLAPRRWRGGLRPRGLPPFSCRAGFWLGAHCRVDVAQRRNFLRRKVEVEVALEALAVAGQGWVAGLQLLEKARVNLLLIDSAPRRPGVRAQGVCPKNRFDTHVPHPTRARLRSRCLMVPPRIHSCWRSTRSTCSPVSGSRTVYHKAGVVLDGLEPSRSRQQLGCLKGR
jgi:hypothetical protein